MSDRYYMAAVMRKDKANETQGIPIYLRFKNKNEKQAFLSTGVWIKDATFWHESGYVVKGPNFRLKNQCIEKKYNECEARILKSIVEGEGPTVKAFKGLNLVDFEKYMLEVDKQKRSKTTIGHLINFYGSVPAITNITVKFLRKFEDWMYEMLDFEDNSVRTYMGSIRKVMNQALREKYISAVPFGTGLYLLPKAGEKHRVYLNTDERNKVFEHLTTKRDLYDEATYKVLTYFAFGCFAGFRYGDWVTFNPYRNVQDGMILHVTQKTKTLIKMPVHKDSSLEKIIEIIKKVGPLDIPYNNVLLILDTIQEILEFEKDLTTHVARHSFGYFCASRRVPPAVTAELMGITVEVCIAVYYHLTQDHLKEHTAALAA